MTRQQFNAALDQLGLSQVDCAKLLGITSRAVRYYAVGHTKVPAPVAKLIALLRSGKIKEKDLNIA